MNFFVVSLLGISFVCLVEFDVLAVSTVFAMARFVCVAAATVRVAAIRIQRGLCGVVMSVWCLLLLF